MTISVTSLNGMTNISEYLKLAQAAQNTQTADQTDETDSVSFSQEGLRMSKTPPPPPPEAMDFENMSDEEFLDYLEQSQQAFGELPGIASGTPVSDLTDEQLSQLREIFTQMSQNGPHGMGGPGGPGGPGGSRGASLSELLENADEDEIKSILSQILEQTGSLPGIEAEIDSIDSLTDEQLQEVIDSLIEQVQAQEEQINRQRVLFDQAISAYTNVMINGAV